MKLISLIQPWATLVAEGYKRFETRGWYTDYRGPLAIHATKGHPDRGALAYLSAKYPEVFRALQTLDEHGKILAVAQLEGCVSMYAKGHQSPDGTPLTLENTMLAGPIGPVLHPEREIDFGDWRVGRYALDLQNVRRVVPFVIPRGSQGKPISLNPAVETSLVYL